MQVCKSYLDDRGRTLRAFGAQEYLVKNKLSHSYLPSRPLLQYGS